MYAWTHACMYITIAVRKDTHSTLRQVSQELSLLQMLPSSTTGQFRYDDTTRRATTGGVAKRFPLLPSLIAVLEVLRAERGENRAPGLSTLCTSPDLVAFGTCPYQPADAHTTPHPIPRTREQNN